MKKFLLMLAALLLVLCLFTGCCGGEETEKAPGLDVTEDSPDGDYGPLMQ